LGYRNYALKLSEPAGIKGSKKIEKGACTEILRRVTVWAIKKEESPKKKEFLGKKDFF